MLREVETNETVARCVRPLHRVCPGDLSEEFSGEELSSEELSSEELSSEEDDCEEDDIVDPSCKYYNETICTKKGTDNTVLDLNFKEECQQIEVRHIYELLSQIIIHFDNIFLMLTLYSSR